MSNDTKQKFTNDNTSHIRSDGYDLMCSVEKRGAFHGDKSLEKACEEMLMNDDPQILDLDVIENTYKALIASDHILKTDFHMLMKCIQSPQKTSNEYCEISVNHLISEIEENVADHQRMGDESPIFENNASASYNDLQAHLNFKHDMEEYHVRYWVG
ncbi:MAG: hypothetical protein COA45_10950 [Zetaproteobacteria bacterium]|nr:MAG: hypothetical protein COA45_10950 [Zetaproteobacteria bacterium]